MGRTHVRPRPHHPGAVLVNLQLLDVEPGDEVRRRCGQHHDADDGPRRHVAAKGMRGDDDGSRARDRREQDDEVAVDAVQGHRLMAEGGDELQHDEAARGQDAEEVDLHAELVGVAQVVVALAGGGGVARLRVRGAEDGVVAEVLQARGAEAEDVAEGQEGWRNRQECLASFSVFFL